MPNRFQEFLSLVELKERAAMEEDIRFNTERRMLDSLAPEKWNELKGAIKEAYPQMKSLDLAHSETADTLVVNRVKRAVVIRTLSLTFDSAIPRIVWKCLPLGKTGVITFSLHDSTVSYVANGMIQDEQTVVATLLSCLSGR